MTFQYVSTQEAMAADGLRAIVVGAIPSPWGEAMKGIFHVKGLDFLAVRLDQRDPEQGAWSGEINAPAVFWQDDAPVRDSLDILDLAERLAPTPCLLPKDQAEEIRHWVLQLAAPAGLAGNGVCSKSMRDYPAARDFTPRWRSIWGINTATPPRRARPPKPKLAAC